MDLKQITPQDKIKHYHLKEYGLHDLGHCDIVFIKILKRRRQLLVGNTYYNFYYICDRISHLTIEVNGSLLTKTDLININDFTLHVMYNHTSTFSIDTGEELNVTIYDNINKDRIYVPINNNINNNTKFIKLSDLDKICF